MSQPHPTLASLYIQALSTHRDRIAIAEGDARVSYRQLTTVIGRILTLFDRLDWRPGSTVALAVPMGVEFLSWYIACQVGGITVLDLPPQLRPDLLRHNLQASGADRVVVKPSALDDAARAALRDATVGVYSLGPLAPHQDLQALLPQCEPAPLVERGTPTWAAISTSSGSTGKPKALAFSGSSLAALTLLHMATLKFPSRPVTVVYRTSFATMALTVQPTLLRGGLVVTVPTLDPQAIGEAAATHHANLLYLTPDTILALADERRFAPALRELQLVLYSGLLSPARLPDLATTFGPVFANLYGCSEANPAVVLAPAEHDYSGATQKPPVGRALLGVQVRIEDADGTPLAAGQVGEIVLRSPAQMSCYVGLPERTAETIRGGWVRTGDIGRMSEDGQIFIVDRMAFSFPSRGQLVHPAVIDGVLSGHPAVRACATVGLEDARLQHRVVAAVVLCQPNAGDPTELLRLVREQSPPLLVDEVVFLAELPRSPLTHKVDRVQLKALLATATPKG